MKNLTETEKSKLEKLLKFDSLSVAETITGESYKTSSATTGLGMVLMMDNNQQKDKILKENRDTHNGIKIPEMIEILIENGFEQIYKETFDYKFSKDDETVKESFYCFFNRELGILATFDTYWGEKSVNSGHFYYNWLPNAEAKCHRFTSSGSYNHYDCGCSEEDKKSHNVNGEWEREKCEHLVWVGSHDIREGMMFNILRMKENGTFFTKWVKRDHLWINHFQDTKEIEKKLNGVSDYRASGKMYDELRNNRIAQFPQYVLDCMGEDKRKNCD